jgi:parvulin-like peptidyl-prolyl isomerase
VPVPASDAVVATVGDEAIRAGEVDRLLAKATRGKKPAGESRRLLQAQLLEEIIARRLVLAYAQRTGQAATTAEMAAEAVALRSRLAAQGRSLPDFLKAQSIGQVDLDRQFAWNAVWRRLLARYVTPERLAAYFAAHHRDFDGTELSVSHVLLRRSADTFVVPPSGGSSGRLKAELRTEALIKQAEAIRDEIASGKLSFAEAAAKYSAGPSRKDGGRLGWIGRHGPMDEAFSRAAFALKPGEVSPPVKTPFGVHLIRCDEVKPGGKQLADVRPELEDALARELLDKLAEIERPRTPVKYTGLLPHFKPGTHELEGP